MKVLVACEFSGVVRRAFRDRGHEAYSCDVLPSLDNSPHHIQKDVTEVLKQQWDLVIAHPPCTYLCNLSAPRLAKDIGRRLKMIDGVAFFKTCLEANSPRVCVENPIMLHEARRLIGVDPTQMICPSEYGHRATKRTYLWLKGLPNLQPTSIIEIKRKKGELDTISAMGGKHLGLRRSITFQGIASAMAEQWGQGN
jgi:hypothetical protein